MNLTVVTFHDVATYILESPSVGLQNTSINLSFKAYFATQIANTILVKNITNTFFPPQIVQLHPVETST